MTESILEKIFKHGKDNPDRIAVIKDKKFINYSLLSNKIYACSKFLKFIGLKANDFVIISANKNLSFIYCYFGIQLVKAIPIPIDENLPNIKLINLKKMSKAKFHFSSKSINSILDLSKLDENINQYFEDDCFKNIIEFPSKNTISEILFTSGTTGTPKGVMLTHANQKESAKNINEFIGNNYKDVEILPMPLYHSFGLGRLRCVFFAGGTLVLFNGLLKIKQFFKFIKLYNVSGIGLVPSAWAILDKFSNHLINQYSHQIKYIELGSAPMSIFSKKKMMKLLPKTKICMHYGLTEASRSSFIEFHSEGKMLYSNGKASPNVEITIRDENGVIQKENLQGEICIKGKMVVNKYFKNNTLTKKSFWGKSFRTGDIGKLDKNGYLILLGRLNEMINIGGRSFSPIEVENYIKNIDGIKDCACVGISDPISGEILKAYLVSKKDKKICSKKIVLKLISSLEKYKIPTNFIWVKQLPYTKNGKLQRHILKKETMTNDK